MKWPSQIPSSSSSYTPSLGKKSCCLCTLEISVNATRCNHCHGDQPRPVKAPRPRMKVKKYNGFKVLSVDLFDEVDEEDGVKGKGKAGGRRKGIAVFTEVTFHIIHDLLKTALSRNAIPLTPTPSSNRVSVPALLLVLMLPRLKESLLDHADENPDLESVIRFFLKQVEAVLRRMTSQLSALHSCGKTVFTGLWHLFGRKGLEVWGTRDGLKVGASVHLMDRDTKGELSLRGRLFSELGVGHHYRHLSGFLKLKSTIYSSKKIPADGRVMVDIASYNIRHTIDSSFRSSSSPSRPDSTFDAASLSPADEYRCWSTVMCFSFARKAWGEAPVTSLKEIVFNDRAIDHLAVPSMKLEMIKCLLESYAKDDVLSSHKSDIISGKGSGCIFLFHGPPGTGKSVTAEAVAEHLHTPLYHVSVGELGTTPEAIDWNLDNILELASTWRATLLVDEADIFMDRRTKRCVVRSAMVGILLRKLEYHNGAIFLTTNRVKAIDPAILSRVGVTFYYDELDRKSREKIWKNFLFHVRPLDGDEIVLGAIDIRELSSYPLNGRQIRNSFHLAVRKSTEEGVTLEMSHLRWAAHFTMDFEDGFGRKERERRREKHVYKNRMEKKGKGKEEEREGRKMKVIVTEE